MLPFPPNNFDELAFVIHFLREGSYAGFFILSAVISYLVPLPEVVGLIFFGFAAKISGLDLFSVLVFSVAGSMAGDNIVYRLSFFGNRYVERFNKRMRENKLIKYEHLVIDNIGKTIFFLRFITGIRFFGPVLAGTLGIRWKKFFFFNTAANMIHTLLFVSIGFFVHKSILMTIAEVEIIRNILTVSSVFIVGILLRIFSKRKDPAAAGPENGSEA